MKKVVWLLILILLSCLVSAANSIFTKDSLREGEATAYKTDNGVYIVELMIVSSNSVKFRINNHITDSLIELEADGIDDGSQIVVTKILKADKDEVEYFFYGSGVSPIDVKLDKNWDIEQCNFNGECVNETSDLCCSDCGCDTGYKCEQNNCIKKEGCIDNEECDDTNPCTIDSCKSKKCIYEKKQGCILEDKCVDYGTIKEGATKSYCSKEGWKSQKDVKQICNEDYECQSGSCKKNKCYVRSLRGLFTIIVLVVILGAIFFAGKKTNIHKKIKKRIFWKF